MKFEDRMLQVDWITKRVANGAEADAISKLRAVTRDRALLIVDYAETRTRLEQLLTELAGNEGNDMRVLLLARSVGDWWDRLGVTRPAVWDLVQDSKPHLIELSPVVDTDVSDAEVVALAVSAFARELRLPEKTVRIPDAGDRR